MDRSWGLRFALPLVIMTVTLLANVRGGAWSWLPVVMMITIGLAREWAGRKNYAVPRYASPRLLNTFLPLCFLMLLLLWGSILRLARTTTTPLLSVGSAVSLGMLIGIVGFVVGHEAIHRTGSTSTWLLGRWLLAFSGSPSFSIEHVYGHHLNVGTREDPTTARRNEPIYRFFFRSVWGQFRGAAAIERRRLIACNRSWWSWHNKIVTGFAMSAAFWLTSAAVGGTRGVIGYAIALLVGRYYLEVTNYIQHFGLIRAPGTPVEPRHAWDHYAMSTNFLTFNLPRHADHHVRGNKPFWELAPGRGSMSLPVGYKTALFVVLVYPVWRKMMTPRLAQWDRECATPAERDLLLAHD